MAIHMHLEGSDIAILDGIKHKAKNPIFSLARKMIKEMVANPDAEVEVYRDNTMCFREPLSKLAHWTTAEEPSLRFVKYRPFEVIFNN